MIVVGGDNLKSGSTKSCGCLAKEIRSKIHKKYNQYDLSGEYGIGWTSNTNEEFYFDLEDYDKIKNYCWLKGNNGYIFTHLKNNKILYLHRCIMNAIDTNEVVDHIKHNLLDNRKAVLRKCTQEQNVMNTKLKNHNSSGITGVWYHNLRNKWVAEIEVDKQKIYLGLFSDINDAIKTRKAAEEKYFGEYSYDNSMNTVVDATEK